MDRMHILIIAVIILLLYAATHAYISCPDFHIEKGDNRTIYCTTDETIIDYYWYRGQSSLESPILKLDGGRRGGTEYGKEHFQINSNGSMIITDAQVEHESYYTFVGYFSNGKFDTSTFLVNVTITPTPPCLVISGCKPCEACYLSVLNKSGALICSLNGSRPSVPLNWTITSHAGISFIKYLQNEEEGTTIDTRNTSVLLDYDIIEPCGVKEVFYCAAEDNLQILESNVASIEISNDLCIDDRPPSRNDVVWKFVVISIAIVIVLVISAVAIKQIVSCGVVHKEKEESIPLLENIDEDVAELMSELRSAYEKYCFLKPLPWGADIPITSLYVECKCTVAGRKGKMSTISDVKSLFTTCIEEGRRVVFLAELGYGKTTLTKWILYQWIKQDHSKFVLIYILLKDVKREMLLSDIVLESLPEGSKVTHETIEKVLHIPSCIILLDGLDELSMSSDDDKTGRPKHESKGEQCSSEIKPDVLTIGRLLDGQLQRAYNKIQVWVTSRQIDYVKQQFPLPYTKVQINGFSPDQVDEYITRTCKYYFPLKRENIPAHHLSDNETCATSIRSNEETLPGYKQALTDPEREMVLWMKDFLNENDIFRDFRDTPLLFILMVHVLADEYTKATNESGFPQIPTLTTLVSTVISCLESRYVQKRECKNLPKEVPILEAKLGRVAFDNSAQLGVQGREFWDTKVGEENVDIALEVGLLKLSRDTMSNTKRIQALAYSSFTGVEFYHKFLQEYLAAMHIVKNPGSFNELETQIKNRNDNSTIRILQFLSGTTDSSVINVFNLLSKMKKWNGFIDCAYEAKDRKELKEILTVAQSKHIDVTYLDNKYHRCAVKTFCQQCHDMKIKLGTLTFHKDCELDFLTTVLLPECQSLEFCEANFKEPVFVTMLQWLSRQSAISEVRFVKCNVPGSISNDFMPGMDDLCEKPLKVYREKRTYMKVSVLDYKSGNWKWPPTTIL